jgi:hypothetical protein
MASRVSRSAIINARAAVAAQTVCRLSKPPVACPYGTPRGVQYGPSQLSWGSPRRRWSCRTPESLRRHGTARLRAASYVVSSFSADQRELLKREPARGPDHSAAPGRPLFLWASAPGRDGVAVSGKVTNRLSS